MLDWEHLITRKISMQQRDYEALRPGIEIIHLEIGLPVMAEKHLS